MPQPGFEPRAFLFWGNSANHSTTVLAFFPPLGFLYVQFFSPPQCVLFKLNTH